MYDRHTEHGVSEAEEIVWQWLCLTFGATEALAWLERLEARCEALFTGGFTCH